MNCRRPLALLMLALAACARNPAPAAPMTGPPDPDDIARRFSDIVLAHIDSDSLPGAIYALSDGKGVTIAGGHGVADVEHHIPVTDSTLFNIASVSKPITAILVTRLVLQKELSFDEPVAAMVRGWTPPRGFDSTITVRHLLSHSSGLGMPSVPCPPLDSARPNTADALRGSFGGARHGYGHFVVVNAEGDTIIFHSGGNPCAVAYLAVNRRRHAAIFVAANSERGIGLVRHLVSEWAREGGFSPPPVF